jgi:geranylgeranyl pyrophosphate synthase|tara:strand:- start:2103 stop:3083 length:981 start_codon:yes stop_codon:yes gene_type:complete
MANLRSTQRQLSQKRDIVEEALEDFVQEKMVSSQAPAMLLAREVLLAGGKRYRPVLTLLAFEAAGGTKLSKVMDLALAAELIHTATLVHDDIYDSARTRRGKPTLHASHGLAHGIIGGDYLFVLGFGLGGKYEAKIVEKMADTCANIASGELLQHEHIGNLATTPEDYYSIIDGKTAGPFATACACAAIVAGSSDKVIHSLEQFGWEVGRAFQLVDDLLDLTGNEDMGKPRGGDVHEGKMTLPIIHALTMLHGVEREQLADVLKNFSDDRWSELVSLLDSAGSFEYSEQLIENHVNRALIHLKSLPNSGARELMSEVAKRSRSRTK